MSDFESVVMTTSALRLEAFTQALPNRVHHGKTSINEAEIKLHSHAPLDRPTLMSRWKAVGELAGNGDVEARWRSFAETVFGEDQLPPLHAVESYHGDTVTLVQKPDGAVLVLEKPKSSNLDDLIPLMMEQSGQNVAIVAGVTRTALNGGTLLRRTIGVFSTFQMKPFGVDDALAFVKKESQEVAATKAGGISLLSDYAMDLYDPDGLSRVFLYTRRERVSVGEVLPTGELTRSKRLNYIYGTVPEAIIFLRTGELDPGGTIYQFKSK